MKINERALRAFLFPLGFRFNTGPEGSARPMDYCAAALGLAIVLGVTFLAARGITGLVAR